MERYLITQSLLSAWSYTFDCFEGYEDDAKEDFLRVLRREKGEPTEAMQNGIDFENLVYSIANGTFEPEYKASGLVEPNTGEVMERFEYPKWYEGAKKVADIIAGAPIQVKASANIEVDGISFLLYGILDALKAGTIYDVKFLNSKMGSVDLYGKYLGSAQHPAYFYLIPEANDFKYLVSDGSELYIESYRREQCRFIGDIIHDFIASIKEMGLYELYKVHWVAL